MASESANQSTIEEIRSTFIGMIGRLQQDAEEIPDELLGKAKLVQLEIFLAHSKNVSEPDELLNFCISVVATMKCSIDGARLGREGRAIEGALKALRVQDNIGLGSILFEGLERLGEDTGSQVRSS